MDWKVLTTGENNESGMYLGYNVDWEFMLMLLEFTHQHIVKVFQLKGTEEIEINLN